MGYGKLLNQVVLGIPQ